MKEIVKVSHLRNYVKGYISKDTLLKLIPNADLAWIMNNKDKILKLYDSYVNKQYETAKQIFNKK